MRTVVSQILALGIILVMCFQPIAAAPVPVIVQVQGKVVVNGKEMQQNGTAFPGDQFQTDRTSTASMTTDGMHATIWQMTTVGLEDNALALGCGNVDLSTVKHTVIRVNGNNITPVSANSKFTVKHRNGAVDIDAHEGDLNVTEPNGAVKIVPQGTKLTLPSTAGLCPLNVGPPAAPYLIGSGVAVGAGLVAYCGVVENWWRKRVTPYCF